MVSAYLDFFPTFLCSLLNLHFLFSSFIHFVLTRRRHTVLSFLLCKYCVSHPNLYLHSVCTETYTYVVQFPLCFVHLLYCQTTSQSLCGFFLISNTHTNSHRLVGVGFTAEGHCRVQFETNPSLPCEFSRGTRGRTPSFPSYNSLSLFMPNGFNKFTHPNMI